MSPSPPREILAIHPGALGDVLQAVPALAALRALDGGSRVTFSGQPRLARFLLGAGVVDAALPFDGLRLEHLFAGEAVPDAVRAWLARFDRVISWFAPRADLYPERLQSIVPGALLAPPVPDGDASLTVWEHLLASVSPWGVETTARRAPLDLPGEWREEARQTLARLGAAPGRPLLAVHPGAGGAAKRWPVERFARVIRTVVRDTGCQVLVHRGPADEAAAGELLAALGEPPPIRALSLLEPGLGLLAATLGEAPAYLGADSGVSHLAAASGTPAVILFSPAARRRWAPWSPTALPLTVTPDGSDAELAGNTLAALLQGRRAAHCSPFAAHGALDTPPGPA